MIGSIIVSNKNIQFFMNNKQWFCTNQSLVWNVIIKIFSYNFSSNKIFSNNVIYKKYFNAMEIAIHGY